MNKSKISAQIWLLVTFAIAGFTLFGLLGYGLAMLIFGLDLSAFAQLDSYRSIQALKFVQLLNTAGTFIIPVLLFFKLKKKDFIYETKLNASIDILSISLIAWCALLAFPLIGWLAELNMMLQFPESLSWLDEFLRSAEERAATITEAFLRMDNAWELTYNLFLIAVLPAFGEELFFRGGLQPLMIRRFGNPHLGIILTSLIFSAIHFQFFGFLPRTLLGLFFGYLVYWSGSLWSAILAHMLNNGLSVILVYFIYARGMDPSIENIGTGEGDSMTVILCILGFAVMAYAFYRNNSKVST